VDDLERRDQLTQVGGATYLTSLINNVPSAVYVEHYAHIVERTATLRRLIGAASQIASLAQEDSEDVDDIVDRAEQLVFGVSERRVQRDLTPINKIMGRSLIVLISCTGTRAKCWGCLPALAGSTGCLAVSRNRTSSSWPPGRA